MITGVVSSDLEAKIRLTVRGPTTALDVEMEAIVDSGFDGYLTLPRKVVTRLALPRLCWGRATLADGSETVFEIFEAVLVWDGVPRAIEADCADIDALVGMGLMEGYELRMEVISGGAVELAPLPPKKLS